jgi:hypothetical protein
MTERDPEIDRRIAAHESAHCLVGLAVGAGEIGGATIVPGPDFAGRVWGVNGGPLHLSSEIDIGKEVLPLWPGLGEDRADVAEFFVHAHQKVVELVSGSQGELCLYPDAEPLDAVDDNRQALIYVNLVCCSPSSVNAFVDFARQEARAILEGHRSTLVALTDALVRKRTMTGSEINQVVADSLALEGLANEKMRRLRWQQCMANSAIFERVASLGVSARA